MSTETDMNDRRDRIGRSGPRSPRREDSSEWIGDLLREEALRHEPDLGRITARIAEQGAGGRRDDTAEHPGTVRTTRSTKLGVARLRGNVHRPFARPLAAAFGTVLVVATVTATGTLASLWDSEARATPILVGDASNSPNTIDDIDPAHTGASTATSGTNASEDGKETTSAAGTPALADAVSIAVAPSAWMTRIDLPGDDDRDWIVVGSRNDGKLIRAKRPTRSLGTVDVSGYGPSIVDGPYQVSWTGGSPEQERSESLTWQSITTVDGRLRITVPLQGDRFTVELYTGTVKTTGRVRVQAPNSSGTVASTLKPCKREVCADVVSVTVDSSKLSGGGTSGDLIIDLEAAKPGTGLGLGLAAVVLR
jgi:hypothetical protein